MAGAPPAIVPGSFNVTGSGAFSYSIPIIVPPGTAGMVPALSLDYSSQNTTNGIVGWGWTLSGLPSISRCARTYVQDGYHGAVNFDGNDRFCLDGKRLIEVNSASTYCSSGVEYRLEIDNFSRVISCGNTYGGPSYFVVWTKAGQTMEFGYTTDSKGPVVVVKNCVEKTYANEECNPNWRNGNAPPIRSWAVDKISDSAGNYLKITYDYGNPDLANGQVYPTEIDYTGNTVAGTSTYNSVQFSYQKINGAMARVDTSPTYQAGAVLLTTALLADIKTYNGTTVVHDYQLGYTTANGVACTQTNGAYACILQTVKLCDPTGACLAPTTFTWSGGAVQNPSAQQPHLSVRPTTLRVARIG